jgi:hypothetical protein
MKIETKYDIGQEVWCKIRMFHAKGIIDEITIYKNDSNMNVVYGIDGTNHVGYSQKYEYELFPTKEELLKSL